MSQIKQLIPPPTTTVIICKNEIKTVDDPSSNNTKKSILPSTYVGDICPALKTNESQFIQVQNGYNFLYQKDNKEEWKYLPFYENPNIGIPQTLIIRPPIQETFDYNYLTKLISNYESLNKLLSNKYTLTKDIICSVFDYLPFTFPIFISCTSIFRGRGNYTHWTYPYTKSKEWILEYLKKCENIFNENNDCFYISEWYLMEDDVPVDFTNNSDWIDDHRDLLLKFKRNNNERVWNEAILVAKKQSDHLNEVVIDRNDVGGSYWLTMKWSKSDKNIEWFTDKINIDGAQNVTKVSSRIGGSCGIKSRCYYQTNSGLQGKYLPMSVLNVCCNWKMLQDIISN